MACIAELNTTDVVGYDIVEVGTEREWLVRCPIRHRRLFYTITELLRE